jgi:hypothetical protein
MRTARILSAIAAVSLLVALAPSYAVKSPKRKPPAKPATKPAATYSIRQIEGWTVHVDNQLLTSKKELGAKALKLLGVKLYDVTRVIPAKALAELRKVHIWLGYDSPSTKAACYHPSAGWLKGHGFSPKMERSVEIGSAERFLSWSNGQPSMVLHELAHAYHHRVVGHENAELQAAYKKMVAGKTYESVLHYSGRKVKHYALNNQMEYFAESTEAYFGVNDFYPFLRPELQHHDPEMYKLMGKLWGK